MRKLLFNLHLYGALIVGIFVVIIGVTGSVMAFEEGWDRLLNPILYKVQPEGAPLPVSGLLQAAAKAYPGQRVGYLRLPQDANDSAGFAVRGKQVFINPYTGAVLGERTGRTVLGSIHQIHTNLLLGPSGKNVVMGVTCVLLFLVSSGIYLWWPQKRATINWKSVSSWRIHFDIHNTAGIYSAIFLLVLGISGLLIHYDNEIEEALHKANGTVKVGKNTPSVVQKGVTPIGPDQAIQIALAELPGTKVNAIGVPANPKASYLVSVRYPEDLTPGGRSWVNVDQYNGKVLSLQNSRTVAAGTKTIIINRAIHTGDYFGIVTKTLMCISCWMLITQAVTGYFMWWKKLRARQPGPMTRETVEV